MNNDVVVEILSYLPVQSLLRFKAVCKFWGDVIDSPRFKKVHSTNKDKDEEVYLQYAISDNSISLKLLDLGKSLESHCFNTKIVLVIDGHVKGLICISPYRAMIPIAIHNPCVGQTKILPVSPSFYSSHSRCKVVQRCGIGFDEDYKVVQMVSCHKHKCIEANLYSKRTNSWREMSIDQELTIIFPIQSLCKNGSFAHWEAWEKRGILVERVILSFDMKNEVFRKTTLPGGHDSGPARVEILAKDDYSFVYFVLSTGSRGKVKVYESSGEGSELLWIHGANVKVESLKTPIPILRSDACVKSKNSDIVVLRLYFLKKSKWVLYDYRARKIIAYLKLPVASDTAIIKYEGSLVSP